MKVGLKNVLGVFVIVFTLLFCVSVNAESVSNEFQDILNGNGEIVITDSMLAGKDELIRRYLTKNITKNSSYLLETCNEEYTRCTIQKYVDASVVATIEVDIVYNEVIGTDFSKILENNTIKITDSSISGEYDLLYQYLEKYRNDNNYYNVDMCNMDTNKCEISLYSNNGNIIETHVVDVLFEEKISNEFNNIFNENGKILINSTSSYGNSYVLSMYLSNFMNELVGESFSATQCNENMTQCNITRNDKNYNALETHIVNIEYKEVFGDVFKKFLKDNKLRITSTNNIGERFLIENELNGYSEENLVYNLEYCNENYTICDVVLRTIDGNFIESHTLDIEYKEEFSEEFNKVLTDGKFKLFATSLVEEDELIREHLNGNNSEKAMFDFQGCNDDYTKCVIKMDNTVNGKTEYHLLDVEIILDEKFSEEFNTLLTDGVLKIDSIKPKTELENNYLFHQLLYDTKSNENLDVGCNSCNEDYTECELYIYSYNEEKKEVHRVPVEFKKEDKNIKTKIDKYIKKIDDLKTYEDGETEFKTYQFNLVDLEMINYYATTKSKSFDSEKLSEMFPYSQSLNKIFEGANYTYNYIGGMGSDQPFYSTIVGGLTIFYNNIAYGVIEFTSANAKNILYIPSDTEKTPEAFIKAAEKKIKDYIPGLNIKITKGDSFDAYVYDAGWDVFEGVTEEIESLIDVTKSVGNVFVIDFGDFKVDFLIVADSSKIVKPEFITKDIDTNISISSSSSIIPLDTKIKVKKLTSGNEYDKIIKLLNVKDSETFDIKLYSNAKNEYITKLEDGKFEVKIPIPEKLKGKTLIAYYVDENNKVIDYDVNTEKGYAVFETDHFSIYTLASKKEEIKENTNDKVEIDTGKETVDKINKEDKENIKVPETLDNVIKYVFVSIISLICLSITVIYFKKSYK